MPTVSRILLPVDFSERAAGAARYARCLATRCQAEIVLMHVLAPLHTEFGPDLGGAMLIDVYRNRSQDAAIELEDFLADELAGVPVRRLVLNGDPAAQIVNFAHAEAVDLIVMPTHGYGPFRRFILGSNTAKVLHDSDCPVWTGVHLDQAPPAEPLKLEAILCAVDLGPQSARTIEWAAWLQKQYGSRLTLLHALAADFDGFAESAEQELRRLQHQAGAEAEIRVEPGEPARVICCAAARLGAGAVVIGRGSAAGTFGRLRTNSYAIIRQSPCPVVSV
jgi:nucleotide-binding universal stress UspA family protein